MENNQNENNDSFESFIKELKQEVPAQKEFADSTKSLPEERSLSTSEKSFNALIDRCNEIVRGLPFGGQSDYDLIKNKLSDNRINYDDSPSPAELSRQMGLIQMMKDDIIEIYANAYKNHVVRKRIYEMLFEAYMAISQKNSADKRKGDATLRLAEFSLSAVDAEAFYVYCKQIAENLESSHRTVSRRIVCMQVQMDLGELATAEPIMDDLTGQKRAFVKSQRRDFREKSEPAEVEWDKEE